MMRISFMAWSGLPAISTSMTWLNLEPRDGWNG